MRWLTVAGVLLYLTRCNDAGALKCHPGSQDPLCALEKKEISEPLPCKPHPNFKGLCSPKHNIVKRSPEEQCTPGTSFKRDCNTCHCLSDGKIACTKKGCVHLTSKRKREAPEANATSRSVRAAGTKTCLPGQQFRMDCNTCLCNDEGQDFSCTRNDCSAQNNNGGASGSDTIVARRKRDTTTRVPLDCVPGSVFDRECNVCRCTEDGKHAACTLKNCHQTSGVNTESKQEFRCTPGEQFKQDCNDCTCAADGLSVYCTLRLCESKFGEITE